MINDINTFIENMNSSTSTNDKVEIIKTANKNVLRILYYTYNTYMQYNITPKVLDKRPDLCNKHTKFSSIEVISNKPVFILALFAFPFIDTLRVFIIRGISGRSPFSADKNHLHHKLLKAGFSHIQSTILILSYCFLIIFSSYIFFSADILQHFTIILVLSVLFLLSLSWLITRIKK